MPNSWHRVLRGVAVAGRQPVTATTEEAALVGESASTAYDRGFSEGIAEGSRRAEQALSSLCSSVSGAHEATRAEIAALREVQSDRLTALALEIAGFVVAGEVVVDADALRQRISEALNAIDDGPLTLYLCPSDRDSIGDVVADRVGVEVGEDASLQNGEARVVGPWSNADLTRRAAIEAAREVLS
jgi:flagellar biosynthesis/type III secretory pathway protein FliH